MEEISAKEQNLLSKVDDEFSPSKEESHVNLIEKGPPELIKES